MARRRYSDETRAAVLAALLAGQAASHVAEQYNVPEGTVRGWKHREIASNSPSSVVTQKKQAIGDLILGLLRTELLTLDAMLVAFNDASWIRKQNAADAAVLFGVIQDKSFRKLEAMSRVSDDNDTEG